MQTEQLIHGLSENLQPVRPAGSPVSVFGRWLLAFAIYIAILLTFEGVRPDFISQLGNHVFLMEIVSLLLIILTCCHAAAVLAFPDQYQKKRVLVLPVSAFVAFFSVMVLAFLLDNPPAPPPLHKLECLLCITCFSLLPAAGILWNIRQFATTRYYSAGVLAVLAAFSLGALTLRVSEQTDSISHIVQWHYLPMLGFAIIGALLGKILLKW